MLKGLKCSISEATRISIHCFGQPILLPTVMLGKSTESIVPNYHIVQRLQLHMTRYSPVVNFELGVQDTALEYKPLTVLPWRSAWSSRCSSGHNPRPAPVRRIWA